MGLNLEYEDSQTPIDDDEKEGLLIKTITTKIELDEFEQLNIEKALEWIIHKRLDKDKILSENFIVNLHKKMFDDVWKWAGKFRQSEKNIGIKWIQIPIELKTLIDDTKYWIEHKTYGSKEISIRFKHRMVSIHCFPNGNGRHSRMMADILMEYIFKKDIFTWHQSKMIKADETRKKYISALQEADNENIKPLIKFAIG